MNKAIVVGRHKLSGDEGLEVVQRENINFPATSEECESILKSLLDQAHKANAALVFQTVPGQVAVTIPKLLKRGFQKVGIIVNKPGERLSDLEKRFDFIGSDMAEIGDEAVRLVRFVNPRARAENKKGVVSVVVDPPLRFEFSHIEWF